MRKIRNTEDVDTLYGFCLSDYNNGKDVVCIIKNFGGYYKLMPGWTNTGSNNRNAIYTTIDGVGNVTVGKAYNCDCFFEEFCGDKIYHGTERLILIDNPM